MKTKELVLYEHFQKYGILVEMYASEWVFCLFASIIPISLYADFLDCFLTIGWPFFYSLCLALLKYFKDKILLEEEISGILYHIKFKNTPEKIVGTENN